MEDRRMKNVINKCKQYKGVLVIVLMGLAFLAYYFSIQPSNIFDEIYSDEISYFQWNWEPQIDKIKGFYLDTQTDTSDYKAGSISGSYKNTAFPTNAGLQVTSNKKADLWIVYWENLEDEVELYLTLDYNPKTKVLKRNVFIKDNYEEYYNEQLADYLTRYQLTRQSILDKFALIDSTFLTDWVKVSDSSYSPSNYGDVKVVDEW